MITDKPCYREYGELVKWYMYEYSKGNKYKGKIINNVADEMCDKVFDNQIKLLRWYNHVQIHTIKKRIKETWLHIHKWILGKTQN